MSHIVGKISFGDSYPGLVNPLDGTRKIITSGARGGGRAAQPGTRALPPSLHAQ